MRPATKKATGFSTNLSCISCMWLIRVGVATLCMISVFCIPQSWALALVWACFRVRSWCAHRLQFFINVQHMHWWEWYQTAQGNYATPSVDMPCAMTRNFVSKHSHARTCVWACECRCPKFRFGFASPPTRQLMDYYTESSAATAANETRHENSSNKYPLSTSHIRRYGIAATTTNRWCTERRTRKVGKTGARLVDTEQKARKQA